VAVSEMTQTKLLMERGGPGLFYGSH